MRKIDGLLWMALCLVLTTASCSKTRTYADMLEDEQEAIDALFARRGFSLVRNDPGRRPFEAGVFYRMENGVYINVVDTGRTRAGTGEIVVARYAVNYFSLDTTLYPVFSNYGPHSNGTLPVLFRYGNFSATVPNDGGGASALQSALEGVMSEGLQSGLEYVGDGGRVRLIVPFKVGCSNDMSSGTPVFFETVEYRLDRLL
ncbi:MAG: DUF4827 domain-containing protein [Tannerellaceae bacterium]|jgi:hypothetical protein|nr:DUF4827 domain-containing protein [Tannerellaceae bacterium]